MLTAILYCLLATTIIVSVRLVGALLVTALLIIPPTLSYPSSKSFISMGAKGALIGVAISILGIISSYLSDSPPGATTVVCAGVIFGLCLITGRLKEV